jgi:hypothetical protein
MFRFSYEIVGRKRGYMVEAPARWPFLTYFDASSISTSDNSSQW